MSARNVRLLVSTEAPPAIGTSFILRGTLQRTERANELPGARDGLTGIPCLDSRAEAAKLNEVGGGRILRGDRAFEP